MANKRVFYACKAGGISTLGSASPTTVHGLQSIGITTSFNLEQVFEIGQIAIYENIEGIPDVELTIEKTLDGYPLLWHLATQGASSNDLVGRSAQRFSFYMSLFGDTQNAASGVAVSQCTLSGLYPNGITYTFPVDGNATESLTAVGNNQSWKTSSFDFSGSLFDNLDEPVALTSGTGGVQRRENVIFAYGSGIALDVNGQVNAQYNGPGAGNNIAATVLPPDIDGISSSGTNDKDSLGVFGAHPQTITVSTDLARDDIFELGRFGPYFRYATFPVEVTCDIEVLTTRGSFVTANETAGNLTDRTIKIATDDGTFIDLGTKNKLSSVTFGGGDAGAGANDTVTYSYSTFNDLVVRHFQDPTFG